MAARPAEPIVPALLAGYPRPTGRLVAKLRYYCLAAAVDQITATFALHLPLLKTAAIR